MGAVCCGYCGSELERSGNFLQCSNEGCVSRQPTVAHDKQGELADMVNHPAHYTDTGVRCKCGEPVEAIQITRELNFCLGNVVKYVLRAGKKGAAIEDLKKARRYIDFEIERHSGGKPF
jgi:hypothetical protein